MNAVVRSLAPSGGDRLFLALSRRDEHLPWNECLAPQLHRGCRGCCLPLSCLLGTSHPEAQFRSDCSFVNQQVCYCLGAGNCLPLRYLQAGGSSRCMSVCLILFFPLFFCRPALRQQCKQSVLWFSPQVVGERQEALMGTG